MDVRRDGGCILPSSHTMNGSGRTPRRPGESSHLRLSLVAGALRRRGISRGSQGSRVQGMLDNAAGLGDGKGFHETWRPALLEELLRGRLQRIASQENE